MDLILLANLVVESCKYLPPILVLSLKRIHIHLGKLWKFWQVVVSLYYSDKGLDLCQYARIYFCALICSSCYYWFCSFSYSFPFLTENQIHASNNPMEHGTNGTNCHQEWPGLFSIRKETSLVNNIVRLIWWGSNNDKRRYSSWWERWLSARLWLSVNGMHVLLRESSWFIIKDHQHAWPARHKSGRAQN